MKANVYEMFRQTKPRIKRCERKNAKVIVEASCSIGHRENLEEFMKVCNETGPDIAETIYKSDDLIVFRVTSNNEFANNIIRDFF